MHNFIPLNHLPFSVISLHISVAGSGIFCFAKPLTTQCSTMISRLKFAKLQLNFHIQLDFFINFEPCTDIYAIGDLNAHVIDSHTFILLELKVPT